MATTKKRAGGAKSSAAKKSTTTKKTTKSAARASSKSTSAKKTTKKTTPKKATTPAKATSTKATKTSSNKTFTGLNTWNWAMAALHAVQGAAVIILSKADALFPVTTNYITADTLAASDNGPVLVQAMRTLFEVNLAYVVAAFFFMSAIAHLVIATVYRKRYEAGLQNGINRARWYEYGISASTMMLAISMLAGVSDLSTLVFIFGATLVMNLLGLAMEIHNVAGKVYSWVTYVVGSIAGILPWLAVGFYLFGANQYGSGDVPTFVYYIYGSIFVFFMSFAVNMWLQYTGRGRWNDYLFGEKTYMVLSLVAKSALAWQVFVGTLRP